MCLAVRARRTWITTLSQAFMQVLYDRDLNIGYWFNWKRWFNLKGNSYIRLKSNSVSQILREILNLKRHAFFLVMIFSNIMAFDPLSVAVCSGRLTPQKLISFDQLCFDIWPILLIFFKKIKCKKSWRKKKNDTKVCLLENQICMSKQMCTAAFRHSIFLALYVADQLRC